MDGYIATICPGNQIRRIESNWAGEVRFWPLDIPFEVIFQYFLDLSKQVEFRNLEGGRQQYTLTVSVLVKNAKLKVFKLNQKN